MTLLSLPTHLVQEIISFVPIKALPTCKLVCKKLLNLISDPKFAYLHLSKSRPHLFYRYLNRLYLFNLKGDEAPTQLPRTTLWNGHEDVDYLVSSCNGLFCSSTRRSKVTVCNPIFREIIALPKLGNCFEISRLAIGFAANKHYKVLCVVCHKKVGSLDDCYDFEARIYVVGCATAAWRSIGPAPFSLHGTVGTYIGGKCMDNFVNGAVHWVDVVRGETPVIRSFDFDTEQFGVIPPPRKMDLDLHCGIQVGVFDECLAVSGLNRFRLEQADVWVLKEYGVKGSWTKLYSVVDNDFALRSFDPPQRILRTVKTLDGREALLMFEVCFVNYDIKSLPTHIVEAFDRVHVDFLDVCGVHLTPSLVSLKHIVNQENVLELQLYISHPECLRMGLPWQSWPGLYGFNGIAYEEIDRD